MDWQHLCWLTQQQWCSRNSAQFLWNLWQQINGNLSQPRSQLIAIVHHWIQGNDGHQTTFWELFALYNYKWKDGDVLFGILCTLLPPCWMTRMHWMWFSSKTRNIKKQDDWFICHTAPWQRWTFSERQGVTSKSPAETTHSMDVSTLTPWVFPQ